VALTTKCARASSHCLESKNCLDTHTRYSSAPGWKERESAILPLLRRLINADFPLREVAIEEGWGSPGMSLIERAWESDSLDKQVVYAEIIAALDEALGSRDGR
jgi:hypothetical protein